MRTLIAYLQADPIVVRGRKIVMLPRYAKARENDFPMGKVKVNSTRLFMVNGIQITVDCVTERVINPFRLSFGNVGSSRNRPSAMRERDARLHNGRIVMVNQKKVLIGAKISAKKGEQYALVPVYEKQGGTPVLVNRGTEHSHKVACVTDRRPL